MTEASCGDPFTCHRQHRACAHLVEPHQILEQLPLKLRERIYIDEDGCWRFTGRWNSGNGYSKVRWQGQGWVLHRLVWTILAGAIAPNHQLDHLCRNRDCCNPLHCEPVFSIENTRRGRAILFRRKGEYAAGDQSAA